MKKMNKEQLDMLNESLANLDPEIVAGASLSARGEEAAAPVAPKSYKVTKWVLFAAAALAIVASLFAMSILNKRAWNLWGPNSVTSGSAVSSEQPSGPTVDYSEGLVYEKTNDGNSWKVMGIGTCKDTNIIIPAEYEGLPVTSIGIENSQEEYSITFTSDGPGYAFSFCKDITSIDIPESVTDIGPLAFLGCAGLTSISIPASVTSIGRDSFGLCTGLTGIAVEEGNPVYHSAGNCLIKTKQKLLLAGCQNSIIPDDGSVTAIADYAFHGCTGLTNITIPAGATHIGYRTFYGCTGLASITIPAGVTNIGIETFCSCDNLAAIIVEDGNPVYHSTGNCLIDTEKKALLVGCKNSIIPNDGSVTSIELHAFYCCTGLTSITIPAGVTSIGGGAFENCTGLTSITIPASVTNIEGGIAFSGCTKLKTIVYQGTVAQWHAIEKGPTWAQRTGDFTVACTDGILTKEQS